jgi:cell envelope opacity-associated protein A
MRSLFDQNPTYEEQIRQREFATQDEWAAKSKVFKKILDSEIHSDPAIRLKQTNSPKSRTRNALIVMAAYQSQEEWEDYLLNSSFYRDAFQ